MLGPRCWLTVSTVRWTGRRGWTNRFGLALAFGYVCGMFPTADLVSRRAARAGDAGRADGAVVAGGTRPTTDLREAGTGNPGAANALDVLGARAGATVLVGDMAKGVVACAVGGILAGPVGARFAGTAAVIGHCHPANRGFEGGKGVATSAGQCLATFPAYFPIDAAVAAAVAAVPVWKQRAFTATAVSGACWVVGGAVWWIAGWRNAWGGRPGPSLPLSALASTAVIVGRFVATANDAAALPTVAPLARGRDAEVPA